MFSCNFYLILYLFYNIYMMSGGGGKDNSLDKLGSICTTCDPFGLIWTPFD